jgi:hypothetical protein
MRRQEERDATGTTALAARRTAKRARSCGRGRAWLGSDHGAVVRGTVPKRRRTLLVGSVRGVVVMTVCAEAARLREEISIHCPAGGPGMARGLVTDQLSPASLSRPSVRCLVTVRAQR